MAGNIMEVNNDNFENEVLQSDKPVVVDFWAPWCGPCVMLTPIFEELEQKYAGKVKFVKINTDNNNSIATKFMIRAIPTVMLFHEGAEKERLIGLQPKQVFEQAIDKYL